jgi:DNA-binding transcriptional ArsR family regulator
MLDLNLIQGKPAIEVEFRVSLAASLLDTLALLVEAPWLEGLDQWVYSTNASFPPELKSDLQVVLTLTSKCASFPMRILMLPPDNPIHHDFAAFIAWLNTWGEDDWRNWLQSSLDKMAMHCEDEPGLAAKDESAVLEAVFGEKFSVEQVEQIVHLYRNPLELKAQFISVLTRLWERCCRQEHQRALPSMERSVEHNRRQNHGADLQTVFTSVVGRRFPLDPDKYEDVERVICFPSYYTGPYVRFYDSPEQHSVLGLSYNCRPTGAPGHEGTPAIRELFPPLRALADETRLQILSLLNGREMYAQEIVSNLDISQSAVSRHLKLMSAGGLLNVRKEDSMKYLSINEEALAALAESLTSFRSKS